MFVEHKEAVEITEQPPLSDWQKDLLHAANLIESNGWVQGYWRSEHGYCMRGSVYAVMEATGRNPHDAWPVLHKMEDGMTGQQGCMSFNDTRGRTKEEVIARMRAIALGL